MKPPRRSLTLPLAVLAGVLAVAFAAVAWLVPDARSREIRRVQRELQTLATTVSFSEKDPPFVRLGYAGKVTTFFADPTEFDLTLGARAIQGPIPLTQLREGAAGLRATATGLSVQLIDPAVDLGEERTNATVHLTARIYFTGDLDYFVQEFRLKLRRTEERWVVTRIATVRTMEQ